MDVTVVLTEDERNVLLMAVDHYIKADKEKDIFNGFTLETLCDVETKLRKNCQIFLR